METVTDSEPETKGLPQFHSIGIQVEDRKRSVAQTVGLDRDIWNLFLGVLHSAPWLSGMGGSSAPTAWLLRCRQTWSWRAFPPWRTRVFSSEAPSGGTLSPARPRSTGLSARCARRACSVTGRTTGPPAGLPVHTLNPGWLNPVWRVLTRAECPPFAGTAAGSCSFFTMKPSGWRGGARRWRERQRRMICQRRVSGLRSFLPDYLFYWFYNTIIG